MVEHSVSFATQPFIDFYKPEAETWRRKFPRKAMDMRRKQVGVIGVTGLRFHCSSPSTSEPLWYATASRKHVVAESLSKDRGLDRSDDDFGFSAAKMRVEVRLQHRLRVNPTLAIEKPGGMADGQGLYVNPMFGASAEFQRRIAEMAAFEMDTKRWEHAMRAKRKLPSTLPPLSKES